MAGAQQRDDIHQRLQREGLSPEICERYIQILSGFLNARMTKVQYEHEMLAILPPDKKSMHNEIIKDLLRKAMTRRENNLPNLPIVARKKERRNVIARKAVTIAAPSGVKNADNITGKSVQRPIAVPTPRNDTVALANTGKKARLYDGAVPIDSESESLIQKRVGTTNRSRQSSAQGNTRPKQKARVAAQANMQRAQVVDAYKGISVMPGMPSTNMDMAGFTRLRERVRYLTLEQFDMLGFQDDGVALLLLAVESHVKRLFEVGFSRQIKSHRLGGKERVARPLVYGVGVLESIVLRNAQLLGDDDGVELERLLLLS